jgi:Glutaredoxin-like domain (DUF836).
VTHRVVVYGRENCHLCEQARETVDAVAGDRTDVVVETVDVDTDPVLRDAYGDRVPVVVVNGEGHGPSGSRTRSGDGEAVFEVRLDADDLRAQLDGP